MEKVIAFFNSNFFSTLVGLIGIAFGVWQYKRASNIQKIVNDHVRSLYNDSKKVLEFAKKKNNYQTIAERARAIKTSIIGLDIINRNLNRKKVDQLKNKGSLSPEEAEEYKKFSSS